MSQKIAITALMATGILGMAIAPASADKGPDEVWIDADKVTVEKVCSFGAPLGFANTSKETGDHGLHTKIQHSGAETWVACNAPATVTTTLKVNVPVPEHTKCGLKITSNFTELEGSIDTLCNGLYPLALESDQIKKKSAGHWYDVHFEGKEENGKITPLQAGNYEASVHVTAVTK